MRPLLTLLLLSAASASCGTDRPPAAPATTPGTLATDAVGLPVGASGNWYSADGPRATLQFPGNVDIGVMLLRPALRFDEFGGRRPDGTGEYVAIGVTLELVRAGDGGIGGLFGPAQCRVKDDAGRPVAPARPDTVFAGELARALRVEPDLVVSTTRPTVTGILLYSSAGPVSAIEVDCRYGGTGPQQRYEGKDLFVWRSR